MDLKGSSGPATPIRVNEISGLWNYLMSIDWTEPWFIGLGVFHLLCIILTVTLRKTGAIQTVYFGILMLTVFCAEYINEWAAMHWSLFARQQYFDSNGLFISVVFSMPLLINCMVIVLSWLWDVGHLISDAKRLKIQRINRAKKSAERNTVTDESTPEENVNSEEKKEK